MIEIDSGTSREDSASETSDLRYTQFSLVPRLRPAREDRGAWGRGYTQLTFACSLSYIIYDNYTYMCSVFEMETWNSLVCSAGPSSGGEIMPYVSYIIVYA